MNVKKLVLGDTDFPRCLNQISDPPRQLYVLGNNFEALLKLPCLAVVGSRKVSSYGRSVTTNSTEAISRQGIVVVSGLALGVDGIAHEAALRGGTPTIAVLPCGLDRICPATHRGLAIRILEAGGALVTEYPEASAPKRYNFIARNRIVAALSDAVLITEAAEKSGSLHTAKFALEQGREVLAIPGNITNPLSAGTNNLIKVGATPVTNISDVLTVLGIHEHQSQDAAVVAATPEEHQLLLLLKEGISDGDELLFKSKLSAASFNQTLTMLEINGRIKSLGAGHWTLL